jgi:hypothetical protein
MKAFISNHDLNCYTYDWDEAIAKQRAYVHFLARRDELALSLAEYLYNEVRFMYGVRDIFGVYYINRTNLRHGAYMPSSRSLRAEAELSLAAALALRSTAASTLAAARATHGDVREQLRQSLHERPLEIPVLQLSGEALECHDPSGAIDRERALALASVGGNTTAGHEMVLNSNFTAGFTLPPFELIE